MGNAGAGGVVRLIQTLWDSGTINSLDDAELLGRFLRRDATAEAAFAALVQRHAAMVFRVCLDVTGESHDAQDAAQATFLILAQRARSVRRHEAIANWLFSTARRVAVRAIRDSARRRRYEKQYAEAASEREASERARAPRNRDWTELYQELDRLPERYRVPILLCDLEGLTHDQAALALGCPQRTLQTRLYRGRERLRERLVRRGLMPAAGLVDGAISAETPSVAIPATWTESMNLAATQLVTGRTVAVVAPEAVVFLIKGMNRVMLLTRLKWAAMFAVVAGLTLGLTHQLAGLTTGAGIQTPKQADSTNLPARAAEPERSGPLTTPITIRGRAIDGNEKPVSGATIFLVSGLGRGTILGTTITGHDGSYSFNSARLPVAQHARLPGPQEKDNIPSQGSFQVFGTAPGYGFAWHGQRYYQTRPRPSDWKNVGYNEYGIFQGDPIFMELRFPPAAMLSGRVVDDSGRPVSDVTVRLISGDYLDTQNKESHPNYRDFSSIQVAPPTLTMTKTDKDGNFRLEGLPREAGFRVFVKHPDYALLSLFTATTDRPTTAFDYPLQSMGSGMKRPPVLTGKLNLALPSSRRLAIRTVFADSGQLAPKVRVSISRGVDGSSANGITDDVGKLELRLPPGEYNVRADPTDGGASCIRTQSSLTVTDEPAEQPVDVRVKPGCVLIFEIVNAKTGEGIPGARFFREREGTPVYSRTGYIDDPQSNAEGRVRAVVVPGEQSFRVWYKSRAGYRFQSLGKRVVLPAGQTVTVRFEVEP